MGLFRKVARAVGRPAGAARTAHPDSHPAARWSERELVTVRATLLVADGEPTSWTGRVSAFGGYGSRHVPTAVHVGGAEGSFARSLPRNLPGPVTISLTDRRLVVSAEPAPAAPSVEIASFDRADVRWVARTGRKDAAGVHVRCSLADDSFFDVAVAHSQAAGFLAATADLTH